MKKSLILLSSVFLLTACSSNETPVTDSSNENQTSQSQTVESIQTNESTQTNESSQTVTETENPIEEPVVWNADKSVQLEQLMQQIDANQPYSAFTPENNADCSGTALPKEVLAETKTTWNPVLLEGEEVTPITLHWYQEGVNQPAEDYQIVSLYSNATRENWPNFHIYAFALQNGQPVVLHTAQTQGNPDNYFYFTKSDNAEINQGFENIINQ